MKTRITVIALFMMLSASLLAQSDCHLMTDRDTDEGHLKATKRTGLVELADFGLGIMLQNYSGNLKLILDVAISSKMIKKDFDKSVMSTLSFILNNGNTVKFTVKEPKAGSGARLQSWGNYEIGGIIDVRKGQIDSLQASPVDKLLFSFYGMPVDTLEVTKQKDYFIKNLPCVK